MAEFDAVPDYVALADRLAADIGRRRLGPGQRYLTTAQAARMLGAGTTAVNRAMQLLVRRNMLQRRRRAGTVVATPPAPGAAGPAERAGTVHIVAPREGIAAEGLFRDGTLLGLQGALPAARFGFVECPSMEDPASARKFVDELLGGTDPCAGFVLVRASLALQRVLAASRLPAVISGSRYPSVAGLPYINRDMRLIGRLLARMMLSRGRRRIVLISRPRYSPGDDHTMDAVRDVLDGAGLGCAALTTRSLPADPDAVCEEVRSLMSRPDRPTGVICRNVPIAEGAARGIAAAGLVVGRDADIGICDYFPHEGGAAPRFPYTRPLLTPEQQGGLLGRALARLAAGDPADELSTDIPVELVEPAPPLPPAPGRRRDRTSAATKGASK